MSDDNRSEEHADDAVDGAPDDGKVLSDEEKEALLEGVEKGDVEVHSASGKTYASVTVYDVGPRNHIVTNSFPRLQNLNFKLAGEIGKATSKLLNDKIDVLPGILATCTWAEFCEQAHEPAILFEFSAEPLAGSAVIAVQKRTVEEIVERFYGGGDSNPPRHATDGFTRGEMSVISLFAREVLLGVEASWQPLVLLKTAELDIHQSTDVVDIVEDTEVVLQCEFEIQSGEERYAFHVVWPTTMVASLLPVFEGQKRDRDAAEDARWESVLRERLPDAVVDINSCVGSARLSLGEVAKLAVGDVIDLENPRKGTVYSNQVALLEGHFGVHDGCYAIEATRWLCAAPKSSSEGLHQ